jgi:hypothetical protein
LGALRSIDSDRSGNLLVDESKREASRLQLAVLGSTAFIILSVVFFYNLFGYDGLPIGWDTPHYIGGALIVATRGPVALLSLQGPYNFVYQMLEGGFLWMGISGTTLEIFMPMVLAGSITYLLARLVLAHLDTRAAILVALATPGWYAVYRLQADLHANLLALTLFLSALILISRTRSIREPRSLLGLTLIVLASLTHIESTLFLVFVTLISSMTKLRPYPFKLMIAATAAIVPAAFFYAIHILQVLASAGGSLEFSTVQPFDSWIIILGPLLPFTIIGLAWSSVRPRSWIEILATVWGVASIVVGVSQYLSPQAVIFAQRAIILVPTPLLAGLGLHRLAQFLPRLNISILPLRYVRIGAIISIFAILALSWPVTTVLAAPYEKVFLTSGEYQQLEWVSANMKFSNTPIFMYNDVDEFAGGLAQLYDNWVSAKVGLHLSYLGLPDYLVQVEETPFSNLISRTVSGEFFQQLRNNGISTKSSLLQHPIVLIGEFYRPFPLPAYTSILFTEVSSGIFVDNSTRLGTLASVTLPLYVTFGAHSGTWGGTPASWAKSLRAYGVNDSVPPVVQASFEIRVQLTGTFTLGLRYWDGTGNNLAIVVDGNAIGSIVYNNTRSPSIRYFPGLALSEGIHSLTITISNAPSVVRNASLDYVVLTRS